MKKVLFYTLDKWAFGSLHHSLIKELYKHGVYGGLLDWTQQYTVEEFKLLCKSYDVIVTMPDAVMHLHNNYLVPLNKIIAVAHEQWDLYLANRDCNIEFIEKLKDNAVISNILVTTSKNLEIKRVPKIVNAGICFDNFYRPISQNLKRIGHGGETQKLNFFGVDRKRGHLVKKAIEGINNVELVMHSFYHYMCMPAYYETMDCMVMTSLEEAGGMPAMEAAAAGRLVIGTPVGYFEEHGPKGGGIVAPLEEEAFVKKLKDTLMFYRDNPTIYQIRCQQVQQYARDNYDWSKKIQPWLELLD
jgi:glycosyltransferase involved in cell wall biosynthesis